MSARLIVLVGCLTGFIGCFLAGQAIWGDDEQPSRVRVTGLAREEIPGMRFHERPPERSAEPPAEEREPADGLENYEPPPESPPPVSEPGEGEGQGPRGGEGGDGPPIIEE